ncbi:ABC transporter substrate-binding protein [Labrys monachus]|uniref:Polar amino acid transport system substrate-binding protein n=1 Tax=Labrys monachus TaxID=217067 RepID=A0ABU0FEV7_9HYPH|nr:ABC transporter substrate-binding protein [Labrys monachus]MDQ0393147.1 polar amino acid transport system substrate-binding protein [Labrys monachus]
MSSSMRGVIAALLVCSSAVLACAQDGKLPADALITPGKIQFAADFAAAPNQFLKPDGSKDGLDVDMCGGVAAKMKLDIDWTNLSFPGLVPGLQGKRYDALCTAIFITPQRLEVMNMIPYVQWGEGLMVPAGTPLGIACPFKLGDDGSYSACFDKLAGRTVAVAAAGTTNKNLKAQSDRMAAKGLASIDIRAFDTNSDAIQALESGQADAAYLNDPQAHFYMTAHPGKYRMAFENNKANRLAIATLKDDLPLAVAIKAALDAMKADGSYQAIIRKWGLAEVSDFSLAAAP